MKDKVILITGSSRGIGAATARLAANRGARVIVHASERSEYIDTIARDLNAERMICDITNRIEVAGEISRLIKIAGHIDALINCAGIVEPKQFNESTDEDWLRHFRVNFLGTVNVVQAVIPYMLERRGGRIVNVASICGHPSMSSNGVMAYSASKAAVINLTSSLAKEYAPHIAINAVSPGYTITRLSDKWDKRVWGLVESSLLGRAAETKEIAEPLLFLASDVESEWLTACNSILFSLLKLIR